MAPRMKFCGFTRAADVLAARELGVDYIGLNFARGPRRITTAQGAELAKLCPPATAVALFADADEMVILATMQATGCQTVQLHGNEAPEMAERLRRKFQVIKAFAVTDRASLDAIGDYPADVFLLDAHKEGGTGMRWDLDVATGVTFAKPVMLAGGLNAENVGAAIAQLDPWAVDTASGVEDSPGCKSAAKMQAFVTACGRTA